MYTVRAIVLFRLFRSLGGRSSVFVVETGEGLTPRPCFGFKVPQLASEPVSDPCCGGLVCRAPRADTPVRPYDMRCKLLTHIRPRCGIGAYRCSPMDRGLSTGLTDERRDGPGPGLHSPLRPTLPRPQAFRPRWGSQGDIKRHSVSVRWDFETALSSLTHVLAFA